MRPRTRRDRRAPSTISRSASKGRACFIRDLQVAVIDVTSIGSRSAERTSAWAHALPPMGADGDRPA